MSTAALTNLRDFLTGTLTPANMLWLSTELANYAKKKAVPPCRYSLKEMNDLLDEAERQIAAGEIIPHEEMMRRWDEELSLEEQYERDIEEAV